MQSGLFEHYQPYKEAFDTGEKVGSEPCPDIKDADSVWEYVTPAHVRIEPLHSIPTVEIAFTVVWDEEHTLGARFQNWRFIGLNGSVIGV